MTLVQNSAPLKIQEIRLELLFVVQQDFSRPEWDILNRHINAKLSKWNENAFKICPTLPYIACYLLTTAAIVFDILVWLIKLLDFCINSRQEVKGIIQRYSSSNCFSRIVETNVRAKKRRRFYLQINLFQHLIPNKIHEKNTLFWLVKINAVLREFNVEEG